MKRQDLHVLPEFSDGWSYFYVESWRMDQEAGPIAVHDEAGKPPGRPHVVALAAQNGTARPYTGAMQ